MNVNALLEVLLGMLIVLGIAGTITLIVFLFWTAWFIPIYKQHNYNLEKQRIESEATKIEIRKADAIVLLDEAKQEYAEWAKKIAEAKMEEQSIKKNNAALVQQIETAKKIDKANGKKTTDKTA